MAAAPVQQRAPRVPPWDAGKGAGVNAGPHAWRGGKLRACATSLDSIACLGTFNCPAQAHFGFLRLQPFRKEPSWKPRQIAWHSSAARTITYQCRRRRSAGAWPGIAHIGTISRAMPPAISAARLGLQGPEHRPGPTVHDAGACSGGDGARRPPQRGSHAVGCRRRSLPWHTYTRAPSPPAPSPSAGCSASPPCAALPPQLPRWHSPWRCCWRMHLPLPPSCSSRPVSGQRAGRRRTDTRRLAGQRVICTRISSTPVTLKYS